MKTLLEKVTFAQRSEGESELCRHLEEERASAKALRHGHGWHVLEMRRPVWLEWYE